MDSSGLVGTGNRVPLGGSCRWLMMHTQGFRQGSRRGGMKSRVNALPAKWEQGRQKLGPGILEFSDRLVSTNKTRKIVKLLSVFWFAIESVALSIYPTTL